MVILFLAGVLLIAFVEDEFVDVFIMVSQL